MDANEVQENTSPSNGSHYTKDFKNRFVRLADSDILPDCEFVVGPQKTVIKGHKGIFCVASDVFHAMFNGDLKETQPVHVEDLQPDGFQGMKKFIYTGLTDFKSVFEALFTYIAARKYLIVALTCECVEYIKKTLQSSQVLEFLDHCKLNSISVFDDLCGKLINENTAEVVKSDYFSTANIQSIELILRSPTLKLESEIEVFNLFERWALAEAGRQGIAAEDIATTFGSLKKHIRFLTISGKDFVARIEPSPLLTREEKYVIAMNKIEFNSNLTSENISMLQEGRRFDTGYEQKHIFKIPVNNTNCKKIKLINLLPETQENYCIDDCHYNKITIYYKVSSQSISFDAETQFYGDRVMSIVIKSKFRVVAKNACDDLFFINQSNCIVNENYDDYDDYDHDYSDIQCLKLANIPKSSLKNEHYSKENNIKTVSIEGSFTVEKTNL